MTDAWHEMTALALGRGIAAGRIDPKALAEHFLDRIEAVDGDHRVYLRTMRERALAEAGAARARARAGLRRGPLDGVPLSWKDLFDSAGVATTAGSPIFAERVPTRDAVVLARASRAGMVALGKTNLTEFAFSALGINPHYGTPANPFDTAVARCPGGSSSGAAVSVARGLAAAAIGSDTGGSVRIPAAWNGLVGLKTTAGRLPLAGVMPLAPSLDTVGPLTRDVADANAVFAVLAAAPAADLAGATLRGARLLVAEDLVWDGTAPGVTAAARSAIERLASAGATVERIAVPEFAAALALTKEHGPLVSVEACGEWYELVEANPDKVYHNVRRRFLMGAEARADRIERLRHGLAALGRDLHARIAGADALIAPTVAISPPPIAALMADDDAYFAANMAALRNTTLGNLLRVCAVSLPFGDDGAGLPVGLMLMGRPFTEAALLRIAAAAEAVLGPGPRPA